MSSQSPATNPYDEVLYPAHALAASHPDRMASVAALFGMRTQPIDRCRVLELGCSTGGNLIPMAERHPGSTFVGIDYSQRQIAVGRQTVETLGLKNIELHQLNIADIDERLGAFDYILGHGVFSWVNHDIQEKVLALCKSRLNPQGVAFLSYNIFPGWHLRNIIRELVCSYTPSSAPQRVRAERGFKLMRFLSEALATDPAPANKLLKVELELVLDHSEVYLCHEYLETDNNPLYFHEFARRAGAYQLQYLGDAAPAMMFALNYESEIANRLLRLSPDQVTLEHHMDLLRYRSFRQSLLCHDHVILERNIAPPALAPLHFAVRLRPERETPDLTSSATEGFVAVQGGAVASSPVPAVKAALLHLGAIWPRSVSLDELVDAAARRLSAAGAPTAPTPEDRHAVACKLMQCLVGGIMEIYSVPDSFVTTISRFPRASELARMQARSGPAVTNQRHAPVTLDEVSVNVLRYLDGKHDRASLRQILVQAASRGELSIMIGGVPASRGEVVGKIIDDALDQALAIFAFNALLVA